MKKEWETIDSADCPPIWTHSVWEGEEKKKKLEEMKKEAKEYIGDDDDFTLVRFLIARQWDVKKATEMYTASKKWRNKMRTDKVIEEFPKSPFFKVLCEYWPNSSNALDREPFLRTRDGMVFGIEALGSVDPSAPNYFPTDELYKLHMYTDERMMAQVKKACQEVGDGKLYAPVVWLQDLDGVSLAHMAGTTLGMVKMTGKMDSDNYPEFLRKVFIINCPKIFSLIWKVAQHFFDEGQKFVEVGEDYRTKLQKCVAPEFLPKKYGGELDWAMPCGGDIKKLNLDIPKMIKKKWVSASVPRGGTYIKQVEINKDLVGSSLVWEFKTNKDIGFSVLYKKTAEDTETVTVIDPERVESHLYEAHGVCVAEKEGVYVLSWDNTYSWVNSKDLKYIITIHNDDNIVVISEKGVSIKGQKDKAK